jgi:hypothetical protein
MCRESHRVAPAPLLILSFVLRHFWTKSVEILLNRVAGMESEIFFFHFGEREKRGRKNSV